MPIVVEFIEDVTVMAVSILDDTETETLIEKGSVLEAEGISKNGDTVTLRFPDDTIFPNIPIKNIKPAMPKSVERPLKRGCGGCQKAKDAARREVEKAREESAKKNEQ